MLRYKAGIKPLGYVESTFESIMFSVPNASGVGQIICQLSMLVFSVRDVSRENDVDEM